MFLKHDDGAKAQLKHNATGQAAQHQDYLIKKFVTSNLKMVLFLLDNILWMFHSGEFAT